MNKYHQEILEGIGEMTPPNPLDQKFDLNKYLGTPHPILGCSTTEIMAVVNGFIKNHPDLTVQQFIELINNLRSGKTYTEIAVGGKLVEKLPKLRQQIDPQDLNPWLDHVCGWAEVDVLCQSSFGAQEVLEKWNQWEKILQQFVKDKNIHKRRASLVLLTKPLRESDDLRLAKLAFANVEKLKGENDILITKAISWILRSLIKNHREEVEKYLKEKQETLPKIAVREVTKKLLTGKK
jgi:3-methyladenine DNA glycosylase AlkD